ncbi:alpha/beta fold hydrolase [Protaetiibacter larvae]|uniref:Alpha/beta hydrolase n=1 Tax=Protaetiibacter larvae TaxID=2592654 RepID=A0A5C1Y8R5_9MICO|nr:alpha/beta hydrolase [Protaetiibacter larvae]QEO10050.1 alpha/beta hydrolase [Protaetiibacter larvae]
MPVPTPHAEALARIPVRAREAQILGSTTRFWDYGPEDARDVIVLAHGYRGDHHGLEPVIAQLPEVRIISPDLPGFGASTPLTEAPHSIAGYARWLTAFVESLALAAPPVVLGHSFGSMVSSHAVADGLDARALILLNPISADPKLAAGRVITALTRAFYGVSRAFPEPVARVWLGNWVIVQFMSMSLVMNGDPQLTKWIHEEHHRYFNGFSDSRTVAEAFRASLSTQVGEAAARVTVPTVMIAGELDRIAPLDGQKRTVGLFPDASLVVIEGVGHLPHYEKPVEVALAIRGFLATLPAESPR